MKQRSQLIWTYCLISAMALLLAANYHLFIVGNDFAPAGLNGIATMLQYATGFSISYVSLLINIPLCVAAFFLIDRKFALRSGVFVLVYSLAYLFFQQTEAFLPELSHLKYDAQGHNTVFPAVISGVISGFVIGVCLKKGACTGGLEIVSQYIHKVRPHTNFFLVSFLLNAVVALASLLVYSEDGVLDYEPVALCITYCFVSHFVGDYMIKGARSAYKFTVITTHPQQLAEEITRTLKHGATKIAARGAYSNGDKTVLLCVVNRHQVSTFKEILRKYDDTFSFYETVSETCGNFKHIKAC